MKQQQYFFLFQFLCWLIFELPIGFSWQSLVYLDLGSNLLEGPLPSSICNMKSMEILVLANNKLNGTIPKCLGNFSSGLTSLDLRNNKFHGTIPTYFSKDIKLKNLGLNGNHLEGRLPQSLKYCKYLEVLDVGRNMISDTFPMWLESLPELHVLILRSNRFYGAIGPSKSPFAKLRIVDLSYNHFTGSLPAELLKNFPAMMSVNGEHEPKYMGEGDGSYYLDSVTLVMKGLDVEFKRVLSILTTIDLSVNKFEGEIPEAIGNLSALKLLNLSHNNFINGSIPPALGNLHELETLDLCCNQFKGEMPGKLASLTSLEKFNVSYNYLEGRIPNGKQFDTFSDDSYFGNSGLCGFPLNDCEAHERPQSPSKRSIFHDTDYLDLLNGFTWKSVALGYGFGMIVGLATGGFLLFTGKPKWILKIVEETCKQVGIQTNKRRYKHISSRVYV